MTRKAQDTVNALKRIQSLNRIVAEVKQMDDEPLHPERTPHYNKIIEKFNELEFALLSKLTEEEADEAQLGYLWRGQIKQQNKQYLSELRKQMGIQG